VVSVGKKQFMFQWDVWKGKIIDPGRSYTVKKHAQCKKSAKL